MADVSVVSQREPQSRLLSAGVADAADEIPPPVTPADYFFGRLAIGFLWFALGVLVFGSIQRLPRSFASSACFLDSYTPFIAEAVIFYLSFFLILPLALASMAAPYFRAAVQASLFAAIAAYVIFLLWPTIHGQQVAEVIPQGWLTFVYHGVYRIDTASNCFPSLHVALSMIAAFGLADSRPKFAIPVWLSAICIIASAVLTKQHHVLDILGGITLGVVAWRICRPRG